MAGLAAFARFVEAEDFDRTIWDRTIFKTGQTEPRPFQFQWFCPKIVLSKSTEPRSKNQLFASFEIVFIVFIRVIRGSIRRIFTADFADNVDKRRDGF
jgi:hypothetical protein